MKSWVRKTLSVGVLAAGAVLFAPAAAHADTAQISVDNNGILNGNQVFVPVQVPVNVCGNGVAAVVALSAGISGVCVNGAAQDVDSWSKWDKSSDTMRLTPKATPKKVHSKKAKSESSRTEDTFQGSFDNDGILNGNQIYVPVQIPINICGNSIAAVAAIGIGVSGACVNGALQDVDTESAKRTEDTFQGSFDNDGVLNGNQVYVPVQIPINVCGNSVAAVAAIAAGLSGVCINGALQDVDTESAKRTEDTAQVSAGNDGVLNGNQVYVPIQIPINICGNGVAVGLAAAVGLSGACINGAVHDADFGRGGDHHGHHHGYKGDHKGDWDKKSWGGDHDGYKPHKKSADTVQAKTAKTEGLPLLGDLTSALPLPGLGALGGLGGGLGAGKSGLGATDLPVLGGLRTSKINAAGVDLTSLLDSAAPAA